MRKKIIMIGLACMFMGMLAVPFARAQQITITVWNVFNPVVSKDGVAHEEAYREYEKLNPGIKIAREILTYSDLLDKAVVAGMADSGPDHLHMLGEWLPAFVRMGLIEDMTEYLIGWEDWEYFPEATWKVATLGERVWGIPSIASPRVLLYRKDLLEGVGFPHPPETWDELKEFAQKISATYPGINGFAFCSATTAIRGPQEFLPLLWQTDARLVKRVGDKWEIGFSVAQAKEVFKFYYDMMYTYHGSSPEVIGWEWGELDEAFEFGLVAMAHNGSWMRTRAERAETGEHWRNAPLPKNKNRATYFEVKVEVLGKFSEHKEETVKFMKWLHSKEIMARITQYDNLPSRTDVMEMPFFKERPIWTEPFLEVIPDGLPYPPIPIAEINKLVMEKVQEVLYKINTPGQIAVEFKDGVQHILDTVVNR